MLRVGSRLVRFSLKGTRYCDVGLLSVIDPLTLPEFSASAGNVSRYQNGGRHKNGNGAANGKRDLNGDAGLNHPEPEAALSPRDSEPHGPERAYNSITDTSKAPALTTSDVHSSGDGSDAVTTGTTDKGALESHDNNSRNNRVANSPSPSQFPVVISPSLSPAIPHSFAVNINIQTRDLQTFQVGDVKHQYETRKPLLSSGSDAEEGDDEEDDEEREDSSLLENDSIDETSDH